MINQNHNLKQNNKNNRIQIIHKILLYKYKMVICNYKIILEKNNKIK